MMPVNPSRRHEAVPLLAALAAGLAVALAFPRPQLFFLAWGGLVPLLVQKEQGLFYRSLLAGCFSFALILYWLNIVMTSYGGLVWPLAVVVWLLLCLYLGLYWAVPVWLSVRLRSRRHLALYWSFPVSWCASEFLRGTVLTGFPWAQIGTSQYPFETLRQLADLVGVPGIGFVLTLTNAVLAEGLLRRREGRSWPVAASVLVLALVIGSLVYGQTRLNQYRQSAGDEVRVALAQGNFDQGEKWNPAMLSRTLETYRALTVQAEKADAGLVIWPESAAPFYFNEPGPARNFVVQIARDTGRYLLLGAPAYERSADGFRFFNSAFLLSPEGRELGRSDKVHLVPFGEYVPLKWLLPFVDKMVAGIGDFSPGQVHPLRLNGHALGVLVCYEAIFPELARRYVAEGATMLVNLTNDAWFGRSSAPWQHLYMAAFRAVENRIWLARAANTGISALVSPTGEIVSRSDLFETTLVTGQAAFGAGDSFYRTAGFGLPWLCLVLAAFFGLAAFRDKRAVPGKSPCSRDGERV